MVEQLPLQIPGVVREGSLKGVWVLYPREGQSSVGLTFYQYFCEIRVQPSNVYGFLGLPGDLGGILVNNIEIRYCG